MLVLYDRTSMVDMESLRESLLREWWSARAPQSPDSCCVSQSSRGVICQTAVAGTFLLQNYCSFSDKPARGVNFTLGKPSK